MVSFLFHLDLELVISLVTSSYIALSGAEDSKWKLVQPVCPEVLIADPAQ